MARNSMPDANGGSQDGNPASGGASTNVVNKAGTRDPRRGPESAPAESGVCRDPDLIGAERLPRRGDDELSD
jgi:hypothetical protein